MRTILSPPTSCCFSKEWWGAQSSKVEAVKSSRTASSRQLQRSAVIAVSSLLAQLIVFSKFSSRAQFDEPIVSRCIHGRDLKALSRLTIPQRKLHIF